MSKQQWRPYVGLAVWLICAAFYMYELFLRTIVGTFQTSIITDLGLSTVAFSLISSTSYQIAYGFMQIPVGFIVDQYGLKKSLLCGVLICTLAGLGFSFATSFFSGLSWRVLMGLGSSFGFVCLLVAVYEWLPRRNIALFIGISQFIGTLGPMLAAGPMHSLSQQSSITWRGSFLILCLGGLILAVLTLLFVKNNRDKAHHYNFTILTKNSSVRASLRKLFSQRETWIIAIVSGGIYFTIEYFAENQTQQYLALFGYSSAIATYLITISWLGYAVGCPLLGFISDFYCRRKIPLIIAGFIVLAGLTIIIYFPTNLYLLFISFFILGIGCSGQSIGFAMMAEHCQSNYLAAGLGFNNGALLLFTATSAPLVGKILMWVSGGSPTTFTIHQYQISFSLLYGVVILTLLLAIFFMKETFCKSQRELTILVPSSSNDGEERVKIMKKVSSD